MKKRNKEWRYGAGIACVLAVLVSLVLPPVVFALWDVSLAAAPHGQSGADTDRRALYANPTACLLYDCAHLLNLPLGLQADNGQGWTRTQTTPTLQKQPAAVLQALYEAGLLEKEEWKKFLPGTEAVWSISYAPGGLVYFDVRQREETTEAWYLNMICTPQGLPVYLNLQQNGSYTPMDAVRSGTAEAYCAFLGLDSFTDWQQAEWQGRIPNAGEALYSEQAQLYLTTNYRDGMILLSATSMAPEDFAALAEQFGLT